MKKLHSSAFLTAIIIIGLFLVSVVRFEIAHASTNVTGILPSDTTWTKAGSPYILSGNVLVGNSVTLTIEAGATVNIGSYYIMVNGTLRARGSSADPIIFNGGSISFTQFSNNWNEQAGSGCIIENVNLTSVDIQNASAKIQSCSVSTISIRDSAIVSNCNVVDKITVLNGSPVIRNNVMTTTDKIVGSFPVNVIQPTAAISITNNANSPIIANNNITGGGTAYDSYGRGNGAVSAIEVFGGSPSILSNIIVGRGDAAISSSDSSLTISNNNIKGYVALTGGSPIFSGNIISGVVSAVSSSSGSTIISNNTITRYLWNDYGIRIGAGGPCTISNNILNGVGIEDGFIDTGGRGSNANISGNIIYNSTLASALVFEHEGTAIIEKNLIIGNYEGIRIRRSTNLIIRNNTIANNGGWGISVENSPSVFVNYNNINGGLSLGSSNDIDATNNWWGTTNTTEINQAIGDYYDNFLFGRVTFQPILTSPNPAAPSINTPLPSVPEFQTIPIAMMLFAATLIVVIMKSKRSINGSR